MKIMQNNTKLDHARLAGTRRQKSRYIIDRYNNRDMDSKTEEEDTN